MRDDEGLVLPDCEAAWYQAVRSGRALILGEWFPGLSWEAQAIEIADDGGSRIDRIELAEIAGYAT